MASESTSPSPALCFGARQVQFLSFLECLLYTPVLSGPQSPRAGRGASALPLNGASCGDGNVSYVLSDMTVNSFT